MAAEFLSLSDPVRFSPRGVYAPTITAFENDEELSLSGTRAFVRFLLSQGVDGLVPLGSSGEPLALVMDERKAVLDAVLEEAGGRVPIIAGIVEYSSRAAIQLAKYAKLAGCSGLMVLPPYGVRPPKRDIFDHFRSVREAVDLHLMLYNVPGTSGIDFTPEEVQQLAEEGVVHSVKWSTAEVGRIRDTKFLCGQGFTVFVGNDLIAFEGLAAGADGWISCLPMIAPASALKLFRLIALEQDLSSARELFYRLVPLIRLEFRALASADNDPHWLAVTRESALLRGIPVGLSRKPLSRVRQECSDQLKKLLIELDEMENSAEEGSHGSISAPARLDRVPIVDTEPRGSLRSR
jgi:4-hydroxy-tetrahydrodipicolinate synthase